MKNVISGKCSQLILAYKHIYNIYIYTYNILKYRSIMHTYVQYVYVFVYIVHTYEAREEEQFLFIFAAHHIANCLQLSHNCAFNTI